MPMIARARYLSLALLLTALLVGLPGCRQSRSGGPPEALFTPATVTRGDMADVVQVAGQVVAPNARMLTFGTVSGRVLEVMVRPGQTVGKGQPLARIDTTEQERVLRQAQADLKVAEAVLADAQRTATGAELAKAEADLAAAEAELALARVSLAVAREEGLAPLQRAVADAEVALKVAQDQLRLTEMGGSQSSIRRLEYQQAFFQRALRDARTDEAASDAQSALAAVERELASARSGQADALRNARDAVSKAEEQLARAQAALARARAGQEDPTAQARLAHEQAQANVERARKAVEELKAGGDSPAVKAARTGYEAAVARVESARAAIAGSTLTAPFDGVVFAVFVGVDDELQPGQNVVYLADPSDLRVQAQATEMDVTRLTVGQAVRVTFDAYPGKLFSGQVLSLPVRGREAGGMSVYQIETSLAQGEADVRPGMLANVRVVVGEVKDVLTIPSAALQYRPDGTTYVTVRTAEGQAREQAVSIGLNDGIVAEVRQGLSEGDTVLIPLVPPTEPRGYGPMGPVGVRIER